MDNDERQSLQGYFRIIRILAAIAISTTGFINAMLHPGPLDLANGAAVGLVLYALWRS